jgi:hypothetical protein
LRLPKGSDTRLLLKLQTTHAKHPHFATRLSTTGSAAAPSTPRLSTATAPATPTTPVSSPPPSPGLSPASATTFIIHHFAAPVTYDVTGFLDKTRCVVFSEMQELLADSKLELVKEWFKDSSAAGTSPASAGAGAGAGTAATSSAAARGSIAGLRERSVSVGGSTSLWSKKPGAMTAEPKSPPLPHRESLSQKVSGALQRPCLAHC